MTANSQQLILGIAAIAAMLGMMSLTTNRLIRRKLRLSVVLLVGFVAIDLALALYGGGFSVPAGVELADVARLALAASLINAAVTLIINPLRVDRVPDRFPTILQDAIVIGLIVLSSTFLSQQLHDDLRRQRGRDRVRAPGHARQRVRGPRDSEREAVSRRPLGSRRATHEGRVAEVTWRATKLRTKSGNFVILPNNVVSKEAIINYSQPALPLRLEVEVGASYLVPPNKVKGAILEAMRHCSRALPAPAPDVLLVDFDSSSITYRARFWIDDYEADEVSRNEIRTAIYYAFTRHDIEIPWPIQVEYRRPWPEPDVERRLEEEERLLGSVDLFASMPTDLRHQIALSAPTRVYGHGERIVRQGDEGSRCSSSRRGRSAWCSSPPDEEVARIERGGYFGEMSLLSGEPRTATVMARGDVTVVEIGADLFRRLGTLHPEAVERIAMAAVVRREGLQQARSASSETVTVATTTLIARMKRFLRLG